jgi:hypothetical protein
MSRKPSPLEGRGDSSQAIMGEPWAGAAWVLLPSAHHANLVVCSLLPRSAARGQLVPAFQRFSVSAHAGELGEKRAAWDWERSCCSGEWFSRAELEHLHDSCQIACDGYVRSRRWRVFKPFSH